MRWSLRSFHVFCTQRDIQICEASMAFAIDHDYCAVMPSDKDHKNITLPQTDCEGANNMDANCDELHANKRKQQLCIREDISNEPANIDVIASSLSPAHSTDSGVDAGVEDFLADFPTSWRNELEDFTLNDEDLKDLEALLSENFTTNELPSIKEANNRDSRTLSVLNPTTKANVQFAKGEGKQLSDDAEQAIFEKNKRNAIAARENRQKKKKYVEGLESDVAKLKEENKTLKTRNESMSKMVIKLSDEVKYLRSVLANESTISLLLKSVAATPGIALTSSLMQSSGSKGEETDRESTSGKQGERQYVTRSRKRQSDAHQPEDVVDATPSKKSRGTTPGGVCLHVNNGKVSLELCAKCEKKAMQSGFL